MVKTKTVCTLTVCSPTDPFASDMTSCSGIIPNRGRQAACSTFNRSTIQPLSHSTEIRLYRKALDAVDAAVGIRGVDRVYGFDIHTLAEDAMTDNQNDVRGAF